MKAVSTGMVFALIFAIIFIGFILLFGMDMITDLMCMGNDAQTMKSLNDLKKTVNNMIETTDYGSTQVFSVKIPKDSRICFIDPEHPEPNRAAGWRPSEDEYRLLVNSNEKNNFRVYMCSKPSGRGFNLEKVSFGENFCVESGDRLSLESLGSQILITK